MRTLPRAAVLFFALVPCVSLSVALPAQTWSAPAHSAAGPEKPTAFATHQAIDYDGHKRAYTLYRPTHLSAAEPAALVVMLQERSVKGAEPDEHHWNQTADNNGFMVVYPQTRSGKWASEGSSKSHSRKSTSRSNDVDYLDTLISHVITAENADPRRIYIAGEAGGAVMAYRMACESSISLAAVGAVNGVLTGDCIAPQPTSVIAIHGAQNHRFPMDGHGLPRDSDYSPSVNASLVAWRAVDSCTRPDEYSAAGTTTSVSRCAGNRAVARVTLPHGGEEWPVRSTKDSHQESASAYAGAKPAGPEFDATDTLWNFFRNRGAQSQQLQASLLPARDTREAHHAAGY